MKGQRRFSVLQSGKGKFAELLHVATRRYNQFRGELTYLNDYLNSRLMPTQPEEVQMLGVLTNLQNLLEHEAEELIRHWAANHANGNEQQFASSIETGYVSFKTKCDWLLARTQLSQEEWTTMDEVRRLRNAYVHKRPLSDRRRYSYRGFPLITQRSVRRMFVEVEMILRAMRTKSGRRSRWATVPPGYATELGWPPEFVQALNGSPKG